MSQSDEMQVSPEVLKALLLRDGGTLVLIVKEKPTADPDVADTYLVEATIDYTLHRDPDKRARAFATIREWLLKQRVIDEAASGNVRNAS